MKSITKVTYYGDYKKAVVSGVGIPTQTIENIGDEEWFSVHDHNGEPVFDVQIWDEGTLDLDGYGCQYVNLVKTSDDVFDIEQDGEWKNPDTYELVSPTREERLLRLFRPVATALEYAVGVIESIPKHQLDSIEQLILDESIGWHFLERMIKLCQHINPNQ